MNSDVTIIQSRFHYTEKAYVPNTSNIVVIIDELIKLMEPYFHKQAPTFRLINDIRFEHPETASTYDKIHICCMDTSWSQIAYQFSHEFCHLLIGNPVPQKMRWFEESICELSSLFFMEQLAIVWAKSGILGHPEYAGSFISYCDNRMNSVSNLQNLLDVSDLLIFGFMLFPNAMTEISICKLPNYFYQFFANTLHYGKLFPF